MGLQIYNTLSRRKEAFLPLEKGRVRMYCCGPTVYDRLHVGNFRGAVFFNLVRNWLEHLGYTVTYIYNYTDIDDKIIARAKEKGVSAADIARRYIAEFEVDFARLRLRGHDGNPRATEHIPTMIRFIEDLVARGKAYVIDGEVFYAVEAFDGYGKLSGRDREELEAGHRVDPNPRKRNALDFVLWKPAGDGEPGWESPWSRGRPGWHIECSTMIRHLLGDSIDIHGGGIDLVFPHHENEIAQSEGATGKPFVKYWMHNNFIQFGSEKMSKSLGNVVKARDFYERYDPEVLKYWLLSVHYRSLLSCSEEAVGQTMTALARIYKALAAAEQALTTGKAEPEADPALEDILAEHEQAVTAALNDDFNTPAVLARVFEVVRAFNAGWQPGQKVTPQIKGRAQALLAWVRAVGAWMALFQEDPADFLQRLDMILVRERGLDVDRIATLVAERTTAREAKDFARADAIRQELDDLDVVLHDTADGTTWEVRKG